MAPPVHMVSSQTSPFPLPSQIGSGGLNNIFRPQELVPQSANQQGQGGSN